MKRRFRTTLMLAISLMTLFQGNSASGREWLGTCQGQTYKLNYVYNPSVDTIGAPWKAILSINNYQIEGFFIAGGDGYNFYSSDKRTTISNRPSGHVLNLNGKIYKCKLI